MVEILTHLLYWSFCIYACMFTFFFFFPEPFETGLHHNLCLLTLDPGSLRGEMGLCSHRHTAAGAAHTLLALPLPGSVTVAHDLTSRCLGVLICKMQIIRGPFSCVTDSVVAP